MLTIGQGPSRLSVLFVTSTTIMSAPNGSETNGSNSSHDEYQYLNLIRDVMNTGATRPDRTGTGTISIFAPPSLRFSLANNTLPLLTTKRVFTRGVIEELLWFVRGDTDGGALAARDVHIWDGNGSRVFLDSRGLTHRKEGDLGPVYGFQWRHFGAEYVDAWADYKGKGVDQLEDVIRKIKHDPTDRRIIMSAWNPAGKLLVDFFSVFKSDLLYSQTYPLWLFPLATCSANSTFTLPTPTRPAPRTASPVSCTNVQPT